MVRILDYDVALLLERVDEALRYREYKDFNDGLHSKVKLRNAIDVKFRSGTNGLNEDIRSKNDDRQCKLCGEEWYMCSGSVLCMILLEILSWKT